MEDFRQADPASDSDERGAPEPESEPSTRGYATDIRADPDEWGIGPVDGELRAYLGLRMRWPVRSGRSGSEGFRPWLPAPRRVAVSSSPIVVVACWDCGGTWDATGWIMMTGAILVAVVGFVSAR